MDLSKHMLTSSLAAYTQVILVALLVLVLALVLALVLVLVLVRTRTKGIALVLVLVLALLVALLLKLSLALQGHTSTYVRIACINTPTCFDQETKRFEANRLSVVTRQESDRNCTQKSKTPRPYLQLPQMQQW